MTDDVESLDPARDAGGCHVVRCVFFGCVTRLGRRERRRYFQTTNGGKQWIDRTLPCTHTCTKLTDLLRVRFTDPQTGWIVGERGMVYRTIDSGFTWIEQGTIAKASLFGLSFPDGRQGWASGGKGTIIRLITGR